jgi:RimJ/RimL family protein N-acetyltransferase
VTLLEESAAESFREARVSLLATERLILRPPQPEDARSIAALANDLRIAQNTTRIPHPYSLGDAEAWLAWANAGAGEAAFAVSLHDGTVIGACGLAQRDGRAPEPGPWLDYWFGVSYWGNGYATEAVRAVIDHAFGDLGHEVLHSGARVSNPASRRVLEKCGFQWTGVGLYRICSLASSAPLDRFRLDRGIWASLKSWGQAKRIA